MADIDNETLSPEELHEKHLRDAGLLDENEPAAEEAEPEAVEEAAAEPEKPDEVAPEVEAAAEEFFPGYSQLPEESQRIVRERMEAAERAAELHQRLQQSERDRSAIQGRLAPTQRELEAYRTKLREIEEGQNKASRSSAKDVLDRFREQYPEEAAAIDAVNSQFETFAERTARENAELRERLDSLAGNFEAQKQEMLLAQQRDNEIARLREVHPDYLEIDADPEFKAWLAAVDEDKRALLLNGKASSTASVLSDFKRDRDYARLLLAQGEAAPANTPATRPLARTVADPNPTARRTTAIPRSNATAGLDGEEKYLADLRAAGHNV